MAQKNITTWNDPRTEMPQPGRSVALRIRNGPQELAEARAGYFFAQTWGDRGRRFEVPDVLEWRYSALSDNADLLD